MAQQPATSTVTVTPRIVRAGDEQGIDRLSMLGFIRGLVGPWNGAATLGEHAQWVRYRGHHVERWTTPDGVVLRLTLRDHLGNTQPEMFAVRTSTIAILRDLDDLLDIVLDRWPLEDAEHDQ